MGKKLFSSAFTQETDGSNAIRFLASKVNTDLKGKSCDLAVLFLSEHYHAEPKALLDMFKSLTSAECLIACNSSGVIGDKKEIEMEPAISVMAMHLDGAKVMPFSLSANQLEAFESGKDLVEYFDIVPASNPHFICLADPQTCDVGKLLTLFNEGYKNLPLVGGLASGAMVGAKNWISLNADIASDGAVGVILSGDIHFEIVVSQGCRPIGEPLIITKSENNILYELAGKPALQVLSDLFKSLLPDDQQLAQHSLFVGLVMDENRYNFERGDFLIRNIMGIDETSGALIIGALLETGQTLQFQLRDAATSKEDLKILLGKLKQQGKSKTSEGAILVSCCGRGKGLYGELDHDAKMVQAMRGPIPLSGFFANGEFGPVDNRNHVHGYTSSLTIIR